MKNKIFKHFLIYLTSGSINKALPFLVLLVIANFLTPADFGLITNFNIVVNIATAIIPLKLTQSLQADYYNLTEQQRQHTVSNQIYLMVGIVFVLAMISFLTESYIVSSLQIPFAFVMIGLGVGFSKSIESIQSTLFRLREEPRKYAMIEVLSAFLTAGASLLLIVGLSWTWEGRVWAISATSVIVLCFCVYLLIKDKYLFAQASWAKIKEFLLFGLPLLPHSVAPFLRVGVDKILITKNLGLAANGVFSLAETLGLALNMFINAFFSAYTPNVYKSLAKIEQSTDQSEQEHIKQKVVKEAVIGITGFAVLLFLSYWGVRFLIRYLFNETYQDSIQYVPWFLLNVFLLAIFQLFQTYIIYTKKTKVLGGVAFGTAVLQAATSIMLVPDFGIYGAVFSMILSATVRAVLTIYIAQKYYPMPWMFALQK